MRASEWRATYLANQWEAIEPGVRWQLAHSSAAARDLLPPVVRELRGSQWQGLPADLAERRHRLIVDVQAVIARFTVPDED